MARLIVTKTGVGASVDMDCINTTGDLAVWLHSALWLRANPRPQQRTKRKSKKEKLREI